MVGREPSKKVCEVEQAEVDVVRSNSTVMGGSVWSERKGRERSHDTKKKSRDRHLQRRCWMVEQGGALMS